MIALPRRMQLTTVFREKPQSYWLILFHRLCGKYWQTCRLSVCPITEDSSAFRDCSLYRQTTLWKRPELWKTGRGVAHCQRIIILFWSIFLSCKQSWSNLFPRFCQTYRKLVLNHWLLHIWRKFSKPTQESVREEQVQFLISQKGWVGPSIPNWEFWWHNPLRTCVAKKYCTSSRGFWNWNDTSRFSKIQ